MMQEDLRRASPAIALAALEALVFRCRQRFLEAAVLVELSGVAIDRVKAMSTETVDLRPLIPAFKVVASRFLDEIYVSQLDLLLGGWDRENPLAERWSRWLYHQFLPLVVGDDEVVRNVLRAVGRLPCCNVASAVLVLQTRFHEMALPVSCPVDFA